MESFHELMLRLMQARNANGLQHGNNLVQNAETSKPKVLARKERRVISFHQRKVLEERYQQKPYNNEQENRLLAEELQIGHDQVANWFRKRRFREKQQKQKQKQKEIQSASGQENPVEFRCKSESVTGPEQSVPMDFTKQETSIGPGDN